MGTQSWNEKQTADFIEGLKTAEIPAGELGQTGVIALVSQLKRFAAAWNQESMNSGQALTNLAEDLPRLMRQANCDGTLSTVQFEKMTERHLLSLNDAMKRELSGLAGSAFRNALAVQTAAGKDALELKYKVGSKNSGMAVGGLSKKENL